MVNSEAETEFARQVAEELVGHKRVVAPFPPVSGSEDFAYFLLHKPGSFLRLGNGVEGAMLHNPGYDFNDDILTVGAAYWTRLVERYPHRLTRRLHGRLCNQALHQRVRHLFLGTNA